jgi:hypothetical protein
MMHKNYFVIVSHPHFSGELMKASADFYYCKGSPGSSDEPPSDPEVELISCTDESGTDIFDLLETWQIHEIESELLATMLSSEEDCSCDDDYYWESSYDDDMELDIDQHCGQ